MTARMSKRAVKYRGWLLVQTGQHSYSALRDGAAGRAYVGVVRHGDWADLVRRFQAKVDEMEGEAS